jgi:NAD(P)-dependent dehydrogenase (short-subunit alcohol dehydrogenase family)
VNSLHDKTVIVTGGAQGIGRAIALRFRSEGAEVVVLDIDEMRGAEVASSSGAVFMRCDVTREEDVAEATRQVRAQFGGIDVLINNAGANAYFDALAMSEDDWERIMAVDLKAAWLCAKHAVPPMCDRGRGVIVNIASIHSFMTSEGVFPYPAAKAGLVGLTRSLALDFGPKGIRVNAICPGYVRTRLLDEWFASAEDPAAEQRAHDIHPLRRLGTPEDIAGAAVFLSSDDASYITGATLMVDGGLSARFAS